MKDHSLTSGFVTHDYVLTFGIDDPARRARLRDLCAGEWNGEEITPCTWEISNHLDPHSMEERIAPLLGEGDRAVYYYLSDAKRIFRIVLV